MNSKIINTNIAFLAFLMAISLSFAVQDYSLTPGSFSLDVFQNQSGSGIITVENTGDEDLNLTVMADDAVSNSFNFPVNLDVNSIKNLAPLETASIEFSFTAENDVANYDLDIFVGLESDMSNNKTVSVDIDVLEVKNYSLEIDDFNDVIEFRAEIDERERERLRFRNTGNSILRDFQFTITDLEGEDSGDDIDRDDIDFSDEDFDLEPGESESITIEIDVPRNIEPDIYVGVLTVETDEADFKWDIEVEVFGGDIDVRISQNSLYVDDGVLEIVGEAGELIDDYEFEIVNDGDIDVRDLTFEVDGALEEEFTSSFIPASAVSFSPSIIDLDSDDEDFIEVKIDVPENQQSGNYFGEIRIISEDDDEYDSIRLKVRVVGDVFIESVEFDESVNPGDILEVDVKVKNQGSKLYRNVKVEGTIFDIDIASTDLIESSSSFLLDIDEEEVKTLRFRIPDDATDNGHTLEIRVQYGDEELVEIEQVTVDRPNYLIEFESSAINPRVAKCDTSVYSYIKVRNLGKYDEDVEFSSKVIDTNIEQVTFVRELGVDETVQQNHVLDISSLEPGSYQIEQRVSFGGSFFEKREFDLRIDSCSDTTGVDLKPINETGNGNEGNETGVGINETLSDNDGEEIVVLFDQEFEKTTVYLMSAIGVVFLLIIVSLFLI